MTIFCFGCTWWQEVGQAIFFWRNVYFWLMNAATDAILHHVYPISPGVFMVYTCHFSHITALYFILLRHAKYSTFRLVSDNIMALIEILFILAGRARGSFAHTVAQS